MELFESGLFMELGEVVGLDPNMYEDIPKQHIFNTKSSIEADLTVCHNQMKEKNQYIANLDETFLPADGDSELDGDGLMAEGNNLLDQLMAANGLDLSSDYTDLSAINEFDLSAKYVDNAYLFGPFDHDLLSALKDVAQSNSLDDDDDYPSAGSPASTISTLASEPSSPLDISALQLQHEQLIHNQSAQEPDFNDLLQSLVDETIHSNDGSDVSPYYDHQVTTPFDSLTSYTSGDDTSIISQTTDERDHSFLTYNTISSSSTSQDEVTTKVKTKKKKKSTPYNKLPAGRKERKKQQNKEAAIRYREKKRGEAQGVMSEESQLQQTNTGLKTEVLNLEREILCMKELLSDVFNIHSL